MSDTVRESRQHSMNRPRRNNVVCLIMAAVAVASCGGGGGGGGGSDEPPVATFSVGGTVQGLEGTLVLQNNGGDNLSISADGSFTFSSRLNNGSSYSITVGTQPTGQICTVNSGSGTVSGSNVTSVDIRCRPEGPSISISSEAARLLHFTWSDVGGETEYRLLVDPTGASGFTVLEMVAVDSTEASVEVFLPEALNASYKLQACNASDCFDSNTVTVDGILTAAIGYLKASHPDVDDQFGSLDTGLSRLNSMTISADGATLAVGVPGEDSNANGIDGDATNNDAAQSGAVFVFAKTAPGNWETQAYLKASNAEAGDLFGTSVSLSDDGNLLAVSAEREDSGATGVGGDETDNTVSDSGAVYVFARSGTTWSQQAYIKASHPDILDVFGRSVALSGDGLALLVGAPGEDGGSTGLGGNPADNSVSSAGAAYLFANDGMGVWSQSAYVKASNPDINDHFGVPVAINQDGGAFAVGAVDEDSGASGVNGDQSDNTIVQAGSAYVFGADGMGGWQQEGYLKSRDPGVSDIFGWALSISNDGQVLAVGVPNEASGSSGIGGDPTDNSAPLSGAVFVFSSDGMGTWAEEAYIKASNVGPNDGFGATLSFAGNGGSLAVSAYFEDSGAAGLGGDGSNDLSSASGAVYLFSRDGVAVWAQESYIKAPNNDVDDQFGLGLVIADDGQTLAVGAPGEDSTSTSNGDQSNNSAESSGAVYVY